MKFIYIIIISTLFISCKKNWLDVKPNKTLVVPTKIEDFQALLDNSVMMNQNQAGSMGEISAGDFELSYASFLNCAALERNAYLWSATDDFFEGITDANWRNSYQRILSANLALEGIDAIKYAEANKANWNNVKGSALFYRAYDFYCLAQQYCKPFTASAGNDLGIPLRLHSDINDPSVRSTVKETYERIIADLKQAQSLLPVTPLYKTRPSKAAASAMLARTYLSMRDYNNALIYADACLETNHTLIDYSALGTIAATNPFARFNDEVIYQARLGNSTPFSVSNLNVVPELLELYNPNDLRLTAFFTKSGTNTVFKGSYDGSSVFFSGLAVNEILLIKIECNARIGSLESALEDLNDLLRKRWTKNPVYIDFITADPKIALTKILKERRKELCFRGLRWTDLRRLNQEEENKVNLSRLLNGQLYNLPANDIKYTFPIDNNEIRISGITQNQRN